MAKNPEKRGLGRGLSALMADIEPPAASADSDAPAQTGKTEQMVPITKIRANPDQPRKVFAEDALTELKRSIKEKGVIQPLIVRPDPKKDGNFEIVAGERRWRAAQMAKLDKIPVIVREMDDLEVLEIAIIENVQRTDLNPVDEALGYQQLMDRFGHTQEKMSDALGKSRSHIANTLRLLALPEDVLDFLRQGKLSAGHARALINNENASALAKQVISKGLSVRATEALVKEPKEPVKQPVTGTATKDSDTVSLESDLTANLGMKVAINHKEGTPKGSLTIHYKSFEQLDDLCALLSATVKAGSK